MCFYFYSLFLLMFSVHGTVQRDCRMEGLVGLNSASLGSVSWSSQYLTRQAHPFLTLKNSSLYRKVWNHIAFVSYIEKGIENQAIHGKELNSTSYLLGEHRKVVGLHLVYTWKVYRIASCIYLKFCRVCILYSQERLLNCTS